MGYAKKGQAKNRLPPFAAIPWALLNNKAYWDLKPSAAKALPYFLGKPRKPFNNPENYAVEITFSYSEADRYGFAPSTFYKVIVELVEKGFIDPVEKGGLRSDAKTYNKFKLSKRWEKYQTSEFLPMNWKQFASTPRLKATPKRETHSSKKGNKLPQHTENNSQNEAVGGMSS